MKFTIKRTDNLRATSSLTSNVGFLHREMYWAYFRVLVWSLRLERPLYKVMAARIYSLWTHNGTSFLVKYLKECYLLCQHFASGRPVFVTNTMPIRLISGLPAIIPGSLRLRLKASDAGTMRGVLAMLSIFRILRVPSLLKLSTITDPFKGMYDSIPSLELGRVFRTLPSADFSRREPIELLKLNTAGPNGKPAVLSSHFDALAWSVHPLLPALKEFITLWEGPSSPFLQLLQSEILWQTESLSRSGLQLQVTADQTKITSRPPKVLYLGRLSVKEEAAGKARVFAITDLITQSVLKPLHEKLFQVLRQLPTDGTFNQGAPLDRLLALYKEGLLVGHKFHSFDLSAATDRLPIRLQRDILGYYVGTRLAVLWAQLLTERSWYLKNTDESYRYTVGQPMGALSSWAMLALTHHYIVRVAASRVGISDFTHYAILGDDIVIANDSVASSYHSLVTDWLGVDINLSKTLVSEDCFEFAKRLVTVTGELTPPGPKTILMALKSLNGIPSILLDMVNKGCFLDEAVVDEMFESVPTLRRSAVEQILWVVKGPFGFIPTESGLSSSMKITSSLTLVRVDSMLASIDDALHNLAYRSYTASVEKSHETLAKLEAIRHDPYIGGPEGPSPFYLSLMSVFKADFMELVLDIPVRRFIFDGTPIHFGFYVKPYVEWRTIVQKYISRKIHTAEFPLSVSDPFCKEEVIISPLRSSLKTFNFFEDVRQIERSKAAIRPWYSRGM